MAAGRGRRTSSPPQFGQTLESASVHDTQYVHSNVQMYATPSPASAVPHLLHDARSSRAIPPLGERAANEVTGDEAAPPHQAATSRSFCDSAIAWSFFRLWFSIWRTRSRVTLKVLPTSSSVRGCSPESP